MMLRTKGTMEEIIILLVNLMTKVKPALILCGKEEKESPEGLRSFRFCIHPFLSFATKESGRVRDFKLETSCMTLELWKLKF